MGGRGILQLFHTPDKHLKATCASFSMQGKSSPLQLACLELIGHRISGDRRRLASVEVLAGERRPRPLGPWSLPLDGSLSRGSTAAGVSQAMAPLSAQGIGEQFVRHWV